MGKKSRGKKKNAASQSGFTGKGAQKPEHAADHGPVTYRPAGDVSSHLVQANLETPAPGEHIMNRGGLDRSRLHPSLRDMPGDAEIKVIMTPDDGSEPPEHAGEYLGKLDQPYQTPEGGEVPAGYLVYRNLRPEEPAPAGLTGRPALTGESGAFTRMDLAGHAASLASRVPWARDAPIGEVPFRVMNPGPGDEPVTVHLNPADIQRRGLQLEATSSGNDSLPGWFEPAEPEPPVLQHLRASDVLDAHARLADTMARPPARLLEFFDAFVSDTLNKAGAAGGDWEKVNRWAGMFWPAQTAAEWCGVLARQLKNARTYEITAEMVAKTHELYETVAGRAGWVEHDDIPWPAGFAYLDRPVAFTDRWGNVIYNRAYSWDVVYLPYPEGKVPGVRVVSWSHPDDKDSYWTPAATEIMGQCGGLGMGNTVVFPFRQQITVEQLPGRPRQDSVPLWLRCLWIMLESSVSVTRTAGHAEIGRPALHRARRSLVHGEVNVVLLRRSLTLPAEADGNNGSGRRNWTCRWFVSEFWRHVRRNHDFEEAVDEDGRVHPHHAIPDAAREHCAVCGAKVSHVETYDKGPPGLPYKTDRQLYRLSR
jgi:hypothetical protein